jgi:preprotein translocase SecF subunit
MFRIVEKRRWYFLISGLIILVGLVSMIYSTATTGSPFRLAIDFTGGSIWQLQFDQQVPTEELRAVFTANGIQDPAVTTLGDGRALQVRLEPIDEVQKTQLFDAVKAKYPAVTELQFSSVGPAIGREVTNAALLAIMAAAVVILAFMVFAFRKVAHPIRYGAVAIIAMFHDLLLVLGLFSIVSLALGWQADALFLTALLTVMSFSMQDKIVVFDRIRENAPKYRGESFTDIANRSIMETIHRSLATQLNAIFIMVSILLFGGATIKQFIAVMLVGLLSGTYSSIFIAVPMLVGWTEKDWFGRKAARSNGSNSAQVQPLA